MARPDLAQLKNNPYASPSFQYPLELGTGRHEPYIIFDIRDSVSKSRPSKGTIALYMPPTITTNYSASYDEVELNTERTLDAIRDLFTLDGLRTNLLRGLTNVASMNNRLNARARQDILNQSTLNPHMAVLFQGIGFRTFEFTFNMIARNEKESEMIRNIIYNFKYAMHPSTTTPGGKTGSRFFYYPDNFIIGLYSPSNRYLFNISTCVLTSLEHTMPNITFFGSSGAPVEVNLTLQFKELEVLTKERIAQGY